MPVFKSYVDKSGYYITARPPDVGNITYQIQPDASDFLLNLGYSHEDELPWGLVKPLRVSGLVYTNQEGISDNDADVPGLNPSKLSSVSGDERAEIISYLEGRNDVPKEVLKRFRSTTETSISNAEILTEAISEKLDREVEVVVERPEARRGQYGRVVIEITYQTGNKLTELFTSDTEVEHRIQTPGTLDERVETWEIEHPHGNDWDGEIVATEEKIAIMKAFEEVSARLSLTLQP